MTSPFYQNDQEELDKEANRQDSAGKLYLNQGTTTVRVLPTWKPGGVYFREYREHALKAAGRWNYITCPEENCPVCYEVERLRQQGDETSLDKAGSMDRRVQCLFNVILLNSPPNPRGGESPQVGKVYVMKAPITVKRDIVKMDRDEAQGWHNVTDPNSGVNLHITKEGQGKTGTRYRVLPSARVSLVDHLASIGVQKTLEDIAGEMYNLDEQFPPRDVEDVQKLLAQVSPGVMPPSRPTPVKDVPLTEPSSAASPPSSGTLSASAPYAPSQAPSMPPPPKRPEE